jgi:hypothetical protein
MNTLSEWLQLMLAEIARKQDEAAGARAEDARRAREAAGSLQPEPPTVGKLSTPTD